MDYTKLGTANLTQSWKPYTFNASISALTDDGYGINLTDDYCEVGVDLIPLMEQANINGITLGQNLTVSLSSFVATIGTSIPVAIYDDYIDQLKYCQQFYYSSYDADQEIGSITMKDLTVPTHNSIEQFIQPNKFCKLFTWPVKMRGIPTVSVYSPYSGVLNDVYNQTATLDARNTSGTSGYDSSIRQAPLNTATISVSPSEYGINICALNGIVNYDTINYHIVADSDFSI